MGTACAKAGLEGCVTLAVLLLAGYSNRRMQSPSSKSNDTLSGISSIVPSKHSGSSHSLASVNSPGRAPGALGSGPGTEEALISAFGELTDWKEDRRDFLRSLICPHRLSEIVTAH